MIKKLATLVIEMADGSCTLKAGEKGEISAEARELIRSTNDKPGQGVVRITALGESGVIKQRKYKSAIIPDLPPTPSIDGSGDGEKTEGDDADTIRALLKEKGVRVPPRISLENLIKLAQENGIEA